MNIVLTPELLKEVHDNVFQQLMASNATTIERFQISQSMWVEALNHCDILGTEYTQRLYNLGFPDDDKKSMLTLQDILDVCDKGLRWKGLTDNGVKIDMAVRLTHKVEPNGYTTYRFVGTYEGNDYAGIGYSAPCALESLFQLLKRDMELRCLTFETK